MFRSRIARQIRAVVLLGLLLGVLSFGAYWVEAIHPVHNFLSFYAGVQTFVEGAINSAHNGS